MIKSKDLHKKMILELIYSKAPNCLTYDLIVEYSPLSKEDTDNALDVLVEEGVLVNDAKYTVNRAVLIDNLIKRRKSYYIKNLSENYPYTEHLKIGDKLIPRLIDGDRARAEDVNAILNAVVEYTKDMDSKIIERVRVEANQIYRQMIGIFGVFVSIFAIIVISTEKMLRFSPDVLNRGWWSLFGQSLALYLPVALVIILLLLTVVYTSKNKLRTKKG